MRVAPDNVMKPARSRTTVVYQTKSRRFGGFFLYARGMNLKYKLGFEGQTHSISCVGVGEIPLLGEMSRSDKGVMAQP